MSDSRVEEVDYNPKLTSRVELEARVSELSDWPIEDLVDLLPQLIALKWGGYFNPIEPGDICHGYYYQVTFLQTVNDTLRDDSRCLKLSFHRPNGHSECDVFLLIDDQTMKIIPELVEFDDNVCLAMTDDHTKKSFYNNPEYSSLRDFEYLLNRGYPIVEFFKEGFLLAPSIGDGVVRFRRYANHRNPSAGIERYLQFDLRPYGRTLRYAIVDRNIETGEETIFHEAEADTYHRTDYPLSDHNRAPMDKWIRECVAAS